MRTLENMIPEAPGPRYPSRSIFDVERLEEAGLKAAERLYVPGESIFMRGDPADKLYLLVEGMVRVCKAYGNHSQATVALLKDGGGFGEFDLFGEDRQSATAEALTECRVANIRKNDLKYAIKRRPELAVELFSLFSEKLEHSEQAMEVLLYREIGDRLLTLLPVLAERFASQEEDGIKPAQPVIPLTHSQLAEMIACTREAASKALGELQSEGLVELDMRKIRIKDLRSLKRRAVASTPDS